jgi:hypothetical protein
MDATMKTQMSVLIAEELLAVQVSVTVEEVTVTEERDEIGVNAETARETGNANGNANANATGGRNGKVLVPAAITAVPPSSRTNLRSNLSLLRTAVTLRRASSHPTAYHPHPWVALLTTCGEE